MCQGKVRGQEIPLEDPDLSSPIFSRHQFGPHHRRHGLATDCLTLQYAITIATQAIMALLTLSRPFESTQLDSHRFDSDGHRLYSRLRTTC